MSGGYALTLSFGMSSVLGFAFWIVAAMRFSPHVVGFVSAFVALAVVVSGIGCAGVGPVYMRFLPRVGMRWAALVARGHALAVAGSVVAAVIAAAVVTPGSALGVIRDAGWLGVFAVSVAGWSIFAIQDQALTALQRPWPVLAENVLVGLVRIPLVFVPFVADDRMCLVIAWLTPTLAAAVVMSALFAARRVRWAAASLDGMPSRREVMAFALHAATGTTANSILLNLMPVIVAGAAGALVNAAFFLPWTVTVGMLALAAGMTGPFSAAVAHGISAGEEALARRVLAHALALNGAIAVFAVAAAPALLGLLGSGYRVDRAVMVLLVAAALVGTVGVLDIARLRAHGHAGRSAISLWLGALAIVATAYPATRVWGGVGASASVLAAHVLVACTARAMMRAVASAARSTGARDDEGAR